MAAKPKKAAAPAAPAERAALEIPELKIGRIDIAIIGYDALISHAWSKKAREQMLAKQMKKASTGREAKDPWVDFCESLYWLHGMPAPKPSEDQVTNGKFGFPSVAFKAAAITAVTTIGSLTKVLARQCFHVLGSHVPILGPPPRMREDPVRVGMGTADIRFRAEFNPWAAILPVEFNAGVLSAEQVVSLFHAGGFGVGVGDWRPEKDGVSGRFRLAANAAEMKPFLQ